MKPNMRTAQWSACVPRKRGTLTAPGCSTPRPMHRRRLRRHAPFLPATARAFSPDSELLTTLYPGRCPGLVWSWPLALSVTAR